MSEAFEEAFDAVPFDDDRWGEPADNYVREMATHFELPDQVDPDTDPRLDARLADLKPVRRREPASNGRVMLTAGVIGLSMALVGSVRSEADRPIQVADGSYEPSPAEWAAACELFRQPEPYVPTADDLAEMHAHRDQVEAPYGYE